jgi:6-phosphogluconolactonase
MNYKTLIFDDALAVAHGIAELLKNKALQYSLQGEFLNMAISGGSTPKALFELLSGNEYSESIPWKTIRLFWVDERCVPPTHTESNYGMTYDALLQYSLIPAENIYRMKGEEVPIDETFRYAGLIHHLLRVKQGIPVFDLILLGMGDDGHTASIFPDQLQLIHDERTVNVAIHPQSGQKRITLTGKVLNAAEQVVFMITGSTKAHIVSAIVGKTEEAKKIPASYISDKTGKTELYLDKDAAAYLPTISIVS